MTSRKKVLVIRFNAIGDIVLTTPTVQALAESNYEVHYLVKSVFAELLESNPHITKVWKLADNLEALISDIRKESYDFVIDLHNNFRSKKVSKALKSKVYRFRKERAADWMMTRFGFRKAQKDHVVLRFLKVIEPMGITNSSLKPSFYFPEDIKVIKELPSSFLVIAVGAAWKTKQIPTDKIVSIISDSAWKQIVLIGGPQDGEAAKLIVRSVERPVVNLTGKLSISESARVVEQASVILSGDTGMMHIAAALGTPVVAVYGSTHPLLGYLPYTDEENYVIIENKELNCRPCTKQGKTACPKGHFKCMLDLDYSDLVEKIDRYI